MKKILKYINLKFLIKFVYYYVLDIEVEKVNFYYLYFVELLFLLVFNFCECSGYFSLKYLLVFLFCMKY